MAWWTACALILFLQTALILGHWPWPDEYQAVQLAVQAPKFATLLDWLHYEGHPPLWYMLLRGLAHVVEPLDTLWLAALLLAIPAQCLILFAGPFTRMERLLIALSEFVLFDFLTISRSTTLGTMLLLFAMAVWRKRWVWLAIALLPLCDFLFGAISGIFLLLKSREKALWWPGVAVWLVSSALAVWSVWPAPDTVSALVPRGIVAGSALWLQQMSGLLIPFQGGVAPQWNSPVQPIAGVAWIGFLALCWVDMRGEPFHRLMLFGFIGLTLAFSVAVYPLGLRHLMLIALLLILLTWHAREKGLAPSAAFRLWLAVAAISGIATATIAFTKPFDTAHLAIAEIRRQGLEDKHWMIFPDWRVSGLAAQSGMRFEQIEQHCMLDFVRWDHRTTLLDPERLTDHLRNEIERHGRSYLVSDMKITTVPLDVLAPLATIPAGYDGLSYYLHVVGPGAAEKTVNLSDCVPDKHPLRKLR
ncbi:MAG: hypothetical protein PHE36_04740 [Novosphingobium sp.]|nr:hypothetical protein [Novosphingobium sp.]